MTDPIIFAFDPGIHTGVAVFIRDRGRWVLAATHDVNMRTHPGRVHAILRSWLSEGHDVEAAIVEDQYMGKGRSFPAIRTLIETAGYIKYTLAAFGLHPTEVLPAKWQSSLHVKGSGRMRRDMTKAMASLAARRWTTLSVSEHVADAICIGAYYIDNLTIEERSNHDDSKKQ